MIICTLKPTLTLTMQEIEEIGSLLLDIVPMLGETWLHGAVKSRMLSLDPVLNLSIDL